MPFSDFLNVFTNKIIIIINISFNQKKINVLLTARNAMRVLVKLFAVSVGNQSTR